MTEHCHPCGTMNKISLDNAEGKVGEGWTLAGNPDHISKPFTFKNFVEAMKFVNVVAELAEREQHHPDIHITDYKNVSISLSTHSVGGLSENDFILAEEIDKIER